MKVLLTGASSFTGMWFAEALAAAGHSVVAPVRGELGDYTGLRRQRIDRVAMVADLRPATDFGGSRFLELIGGQDFDILAHHAAYVTDYRSLQFDVAAAFANNTRNIQAILEVMARRGLKAIVATGSVFENDEGGGDEPLEAFSPYGLSKSMTFEAVRFWSHRLGIPVGKFVISNPFGPYEEPRFCNYLLKRWFNSEVATVSTPKYLRDNIHVDLLSLAYVQFVDAVGTERRDRKIGPSGYVETQGVFAQRFAGEMRHRLGLACELNLFDQSEFPEPRARYNKTTLETKSLGWLETDAWRRLSQYYESIFKV